MTNENQVEVCSINYKFCLKQLKYYAKNSEIIKNLITIQNICDIIFVKIVRMISYN